MISEQQDPSTIKKVYNLFLATPFSNPAHHQVNPYVLLNQLNKAVKEKFDIEFVQIKYVLTKNQQVKNLNEKYQKTGKIFQIERQVNKIFHHDKLGNSALSFLKEYLFQEADRLNPPTDYSSEELEKGWEKELKQQQMKRLNSVKQKIDGIMGFINSFINKKGESKKYPNPIKSIQAFKRQFSKEQNVKNEYKIFGKAYMNQPVFQKIRDESKAKDKKTEVMFKYNDKEVKLFLNPSMQKSIQSINKQYRINFWSLSTFHENNFYNYFNTEEIQKLMMINEPTVKIVNSISFNEGRERIQSIGIMSFLWNQTIMKLVVKMAQIKKIQRAVKDGKYEYYFHLKYPPIFYITQLKSDEANSEKFIHFQDRVTNFPLLENAIIKKNNFLRLFLFNNTILRIHLDLKSELFGGNYCPIEEAHGKLEEIFKLYSGTFDVETKTDFLTSNFKMIRSLSEKMDFQNLNRLKMEDLQKENQDKLWMIKYLILVLVRMNYIVPTLQQIGEIIKTIQKDKKSQALDCYIYVLWRAATCFPALEDKKFDQYFQIQSERVKKLNLKNILQRIMFSSDSIVHIFRVSLTPSGLLFNPPTPEMKGRLLKQFVNYSQFFLRLSINEESEIQLKNQKYITKIYFKKEMKEIIVFNRAYDPLGWSPSQLRSFSLWYFHPVSGRNTKQKTFEIQKLQRSQILDFLGDFKEIENPAKKAARIGQSFSSSWTFKAEQIQYKIIPDIASKDQNIIFTDGIGKISGQLLESISLKLKIRDLKVIQVRYLGAKGVLVFDPNLKQNQVHLRKSMIKYPCEDKRAKKYLDILDWNKYKAGYLNRQIIILLRTLGIEDIVFTTVQEEHIKGIENTTFKDCSIFNFFGDDINLDINNIQPANKTILSLLNAGFQLENEPFFRGILQTLKKNGYYQLKVKSNIRIQKSARIIGIIDQDGVLQQNEVYCSVYDHLPLNKNKEVVEGQAIITRNPCLHPADIRIVTCIGKKQIQERCTKAGIQNKFQQIDNVVFMPRKGKHPLTSQISGSDLDGDNFFICWDDRLIPKKAHEAVLIDHPATGNKPKIESKKQFVYEKEEEMYNRMLDFFIDYTNYEKLGQIDNSHLVHADRDLNNYALNKKCMQLAQIHGKAVDYPKTGTCPYVDPALFCSQYPDFMQKQNSPSYFSQSILGKLYRDIKDKIQTLLQKQVDEKVTKIDEDLIFNYKFDQTKDEVKNCLLLLRQYSREITNLINLLGVDSEYEIYTGNFSPVKNKVKIFGKNRLIASIFSLRQRFFDQFFDGMHEDGEKYQEINHQQQHMRKASYFSEETLRKAQIYYLISYLRKFPEIKQQNEKFKRLKEMINGALEQIKVMNQKEKYCGFVWFIIPKIILNLKITCRESKIQENKEISNEDEDEEQL